jgi:hypothetical protein
MWVWVWAKDVCLILRFDLTISLNDLVLVSHSISRHLDRDVDNNHKEDVASSRTFYGNSIYRLRHPSCSLAPPSKPVNLGLLIVH